ncbi:MAG: hypothetical protein M1832_001983 [Thelocarpon impressellum]|nr:MAG: hypothetical protein M1832_001983 [Thelocarpon impressellum]
MPIFHDRGLSPERPTEPPDDAAVDATESPELSEECPSTKLVDGLVDGPLPAEPEPPAPDAGLAISDRSELIERIKRGESPTWVPNRTLEDYFHNADNPPKRPGKTSPSPLLPAAEVEPRPATPPDSDGQLSAAAEIERPRSALHAGDFTQDAHPRHEPLQPSLDTSFVTQCVPAAPFGSSPTTPWYTPRSSPAFAPFQHEPRFPSTSGERPPRSRAPSFSSLSSGFVFRPPTSPLVQTSSNAEPDFYPASPPKGSRRHTLPPHALLSLQSSPPGHVPTVHDAHRHLVSARRESSLPYQAHQPRRSLTSSLSFHPNSSPQTPALLRSRRPSLSDVSPLQHAPMVGSYEESILRGRMSTVPSKPLSFVAQIGVLGLGNCKPQLRCPAHVSVPFPAVFYSYGRSDVGRMPGLEDGPSPYVGLIDVENALKGPDEADDRRKRRSMGPSGVHPSPLEADADEAHAMQGLSELELRRREKRKRRSASPRAPPGGSYRIPQKGQLQIVIKNPNKTAVKLFLVPYDLHGMEPGTKTFIRQRSYSTGPVLDTPLGPRGASTGEPGDRPTLRYLIHLHMCSPSRGRFYLYKSIRVVFANRVPDGKEKLRNEIQLPEPRYSGWKPGRDPHPRSVRRQSFGFLGAGYDALDGVGPDAGREPFAYPTTSPSAPTQPIPFSLGGLSSQGGHAEDMDVDRMTSDLTVRRRGPVGSWNSVSTGAGSGNGDGTYGKLNRGDVGYGGPDGSEGGEGLLARRLRGLDVQRDVDGMTAEADV